MISRKLSFPTAIGFGVASALSTLTPAQAVGVPGCGEVDPGVTLTNKGDYCEATFNNIGAAQLTLPDGISDLYGIVVAGGSGTYLYNFNVPNSQRDAVGYAGDGGEAQAFTWSNLPGRAKIDVVVGAAGTNSTPNSDGSNASGTSGEASAVSISNSNFSVTSAGAQVGTDRANCTFPGGWYPNQPYLAVSRGASGTGVVPSMNDANANEPCSAAPGLNTASLNSIPIFSDATADFARGGGVYASAPAALQRGEGASVVVNTVTQLISSAPAQPGIVILRYASVPVYFGITFDGNGATSGSAPIDSTTYRFGSTTAVWAKPRNLIRDGYTFTGWNTLPDGSGTQFSVGATVTIKSDIKLFAQWQKNLVAQTKNKRIATFGGDSSTLSTAMKSQITNWVRALPQGAKVVCTGSTSGKKVTAFDIRLAKSRALNVCRYAVQVKPELAYRVEINPSASSDISARSVLLSLGF